jgi:hypothetical protein
MWNRKGLLTVATIAAAISATGTATAAAAVPTATTPSYVTNAPGTHKADLPNTSGSTATPAVAPVTRRPARAPQAWSCRDATAAITGARVYASICWQNGTAKIAGQIYDNKADHRSACVQYTHAGGTNPWNICNNNGSGTSKHFVTGQFRYDAGVYIRACTENNVSPARCSGWH